VGAELGDRNIHFLIVVGISGVDRLGAAARSWLIQGSLTGRNDVNGRRRSWGQFGVGGLDLPLA
jgi:hypothetical protein